MDFQNLMGGDCGEVNSLAQFSQHMVQDVARQDIVGQPSTSSGLAPNSFMPPQSFRMHDLMKEMKAIEQPQRSCMPAEHITSSFDSQWATGYQESLDYSNMMCTRDNESFWNMGLPNPQVYLPSYTPYNFQPQLENNSGYLDDKSRIIVDSLDQLDNIYQCEEPKNQPLECTVQQDTEPKPVPKKYWKGIPIENEAKLLRRLATTTELHTFFSSMCDYGEKCRDAEWELENPNKIYKSVFTKDNLLQHGEDNEYRHIKDNPVRNCKTPFASAKRELDMGNIEDAILYADEAARQNPGDVDQWLFLLNLYHDEFKIYESFFVAKQIIRLDPTQTSAYTMAIIVYFHVGCYYQPFEMMVHWLKNHKSYGDIPLNFSMVENTSELDGYAKTWVNSNQHIIDGVKNMLLTAARRNPTNADPDVQFLLSFIFTLTNEHDKSSDCITTIACSKAVNLRSPQSSYNAGFTLVHAGKPLEALDHLLNAFEKSENPLKLVTCQLIGIIYMYLSDYREAIWYFKEALEIDPSDEEFALPTRGDILEAENELCLKLYSKLHRELNPK